MKTLSRIAAAFGMAAAIGLAAPAFAQDAPQAPQEAPAGDSRVQRYEDLQTALSDMQAAHEQRRTEIAAEIKESNPSISDINLTLETERRMNEELAQSLTQREATRWDEQGAPFIDLPDEFERAVRGCTVDGYIYRVPYNLVVDFDSIAGVPADDTPAFRQSLFYRMVQADESSLLGVSGSDAFMEALKDMTGGVHNTMQSVTGRLIDEASVDIIGTDSFKDLVGVATEQITERIQRRYGVTITIETGDAAQQAGRCGVVPSSAPQPQP